jgi:capsule polysaccharide export protein KpsE/RkpR
LIAALALLWRQRGVLFRWAAVGLLFSTVIAFLIPAQYTATARIMPPDQGAGAGMAAVLASVVGKTGSDVGSMTSDFLGMKSTSDLFLGILKSRTVQDSVIRKFDLRKVYSYNRWEDARKLLEKRTDLSSDRKSGIITVMVEDRSPQRAAGMAAEYVAELDRVVTSLNNSAAHKERVFLEQRLAQANQDLEAAEQDFSKFATKNTAIDIKEQGRAMLGTAAAVEAQLISAQTELQGLRQLYTESNGRVRTAEARVNELKHQLQMLGGNGSPPPNPDSSAGQDADYPTIRQLPGLGVPYADLYRRVTVQEAVFVTLTKQYEMAKLEEAKESLSVKVLDAPEPPEKKSFPPRILLILGGTFLAFAGGAFWLWLHDRWQHADHSDPGTRLAQEILDSFKVTSNGRFPDEDSGEIS